MRDASIDVPFSSNEIIYVENMFSTHISILMDLYTHPKDTYIMCPDK